MNLKNKSLFREECYIGGKWLTADSNQVIPVFNPFDGKQLGVVPNFGKKEAQAAIAKAYEAFSHWQQLTALSRCQIMLRWAHLIDQNKEDLATLMTLEQGKPKAESLNEIDYANSFIKWFAEEGRRIYGDIIPSNKLKQHLLVLKQPVGVVAAITPWNFPTAMITRKCGPALASGCTFIVKPASETPFSALALAALAEEAGIPAGVFNVITGHAESIGDEFTQNPLVNKLSFTGSTKIGKLLMEKSAGTLKKLSLELGGNAPFIVFENCDLEKAVKGAIASKFRNAGQTCVCANRLLIQDSIYAQFTDLFIKATKQLKLGNGLDPDTQIGPLISEDAIKKVKTHTQDAVSKGAKIVLGGSPSSIGPLFFEPTILINATEEMLIAKEETFGPVAALFRFKTEDEAIRMANNTQYGLASYFYSENINQIWRVAENLQYGMVGINEGIISTEVAPFGGIKESGMGREGSKYGIEDYLEIKYLCMSS